MIYLIISQIISFVLIAILFRTNFKTKNVIKNISVSVESFGESLENNFTNILNHISAIKNSINIMQLGLLADNLIAKKSKKIKEEMQINTEDHIVLLKDLIPKGE